MRDRSLAGALSVFCLLIPVSPLFSQDLGPNFTKVRDGIYVESTNLANSNCSFVVTKDGVVVINSGNDPTDARAVVAAVKNLTPQPIRLLIDTETHLDHTSYHFVFSPPALIIAGEGSAAAMQKDFRPEAIQKQTEQSAEMRDALQGFKFVTPQIEFHEKMTLNLGDTTFELMDVKNIHSAKDTAVWLPKERVLFASSGALPKMYPFIRPPVTIPDILAGIRMMKALNPDVVIPPHGAPGTAKMFDDATQFYNTYLERVGKMVQDGKSLDQIKQDVRVPEFDDWINSARMKPFMIEAAYQAVKSGYKPSTP